MMNNSTMSKWIQKLLMNHKTRTTNMMSVIKDFLARKGIELKSNLLTILIDTLVVERDTLDDALMKSRKVMCALTMVAKSSMGLKAHSICT